MICFVMKAWKSSQYGNGQQLWQGLLSWKRAAGIQYLLAAALMQNRGADHLKNQLYGTVLRPGLALSQSPLVCIITKSCIIMFSAKMYEKMKD